MLPYMPRQRLRSIPNRFKLDTSRSSGLSRPVYDFFGLVDRIGQLAMGSGFAGLAAIPVNYCYPPACGHLLSGHPKAPVLKLRHENPSEKCSMREHLGRFGKFGRMIRNFSL